MSNEISPLSQRAGDFPDIYNNVNAADDAHISNYVFANSSDFLNELQKIMPKVKTHSTAGVKQFDLGDYAASTKDPKERAAASLAADHYDQLLDMPNLKPDMTGMPAEVLTDTDVKRIKDMVAGDTHWDKLEDKIDMGLGIILTASGTLLIGTGAAAAGMTGDLPLAIGGGTLAAAMGLGTGKLAVDFADYNSEFDAKSTQDRAVINSWIGVRNKDS